MSRAKCIMIQGTMSDVGKSILTTALCRIFRQDGYRTAPFKSQNMALNSFVTFDGKEIGRAQAVQAEAAGILPDERMNPILLKPTDDRGSQVIINGKVYGQMKATEYFDFKRTLLPTVKGAYDSLAEDYDIIVVEGAGSPVELNLKKDDIVNMGLAELLDAPVLLCGDIDRGGIFAQLYGTTELLEPCEKDRVKGLLINKFRGDFELLRPGLSILEEKTGVPVLGVVPYLQTKIDGEDSLSLNRFEKQKNVDNTMFDIAVVRFSHIANYTDIGPLLYHPLCRVRFVETAEELQIPDAIILPGTKSTISDLLKLRESGLEERIKVLAAFGTPLIGICGGYQMLGEEIFDPYGAEAGGQTYTEGMGLLPVQTRFLTEKKTTRTKARVINGDFADAELEGFEIHMGQSTVAGDPFLRCEDGSAEGCVKGTICGTYMHGLFDNGKLTERLLRFLAGRKGIVLEELTVTEKAATMEAEYDKLAKTVREGLSMGRIYEAMGLHEKS